MDVTLIYIVVIVLMVLASAVKIVQEYERGVIFRLGRLVGARGPGLFFIIPLLEKMTKIDLRTIVLDIPPQEVITKDNVTTRVNAVVYYRVMDPSKAVVQVEHFPAATAQMALTTLRGVIGQVELDEVLSERDKINKRLQEIIDEATDPWGIKVSAVEIKDVELPEAMQRA
ncbi:MAG: slipin family protein, partial [Methanosarcinales archaeon]|nr:slipin family protein [Methanosarcinales archaeon]